MWDSDLQLEHVTCPCNQFLSKLPDHCFVQGHVAAGLEEFRSLLPNSGSIALASAASTFFPGKDNWKTRSKALFDAWLKRHRLPHTLHGRFQDFCDEQWVAHSQALEESGRLT